MINSALVSDYAVKPVPKWAADKLRVFNDPRFVFEPQAHKYTLNGRELVSATSWVKKYSKPFERELVAQKREAATGLPAQSFLDEWERAAWIGTKTHEFIEHFYRGTVTSEMALCDPEVSLRCDKFLQLYRKHLHRITPVAQELRVFSEALGLCGTIDFLGQGNDGRLVVLDWKTSKKIDTDSDKIWSYLKTPFACYGDNEHNKYSLQISLYRVLLEEAGIATGGGGFIVWLPTGAKEPQLIKALDLREPVRHAIELAKPSF